MLSLRYTGTTVLLPLIAPGFVKFDAVVHVTPVSDLLEGRDEFGVAARKESEELVVTVSLYLKDMMFNVASPSYYPFSPPTTSRLLVRRSSLPGVDHLRLF